MDRRKRIGLLMLSMGLAVFGGLIPLLGEHGTITDATHFIAGLLVGAGATIVLGIVAVRRFGRSSC